MRACKHLNISNKPIQELNSSPMIDGRLRARKNCGQSPVSFRGPRHLDLRNADLVALDRLQLQRRGREPCFTGQFFTVATKRSARRLEAGWEVAVKKMLYSDKCIHFQTSFVFTEDSTGRPVYDIHQLDVPHKDGLMFLVFYAVQKMKFRTAECRTTVGKKRTRCAAQCKSAARNKYDISARCNSTCTMCQPSREPRSYKQVHNSPPARDPTAVMATAMLIWVSLKLLGIPVAQQRLIFQGRVLPDNARMVDCGVQNKVIHLVPRPPPSTQSEGQSGSTTASGGHTLAPGGGGITWSGVDMQQAIQDITAGIFSGLGEFGRSIHFPPHTSGDPPGGARYSAVLAREHTFNRLHRQASHLLRRVIRHPFFPTPEQASDSTLDESSPLDSPTAETQIVAPTADGSGTSALDSVSKSGTAELSPMVTDSDQECHVTAASNVVADVNDAVVQNQASQVENSSGSSSSAPVERPISVLADMISRHRRLWRSAEPYLDRWEAMLNAESRAQEELLNREQTGQETKPVEPTHPTRGSACVLAFIFLYFFQFFLQISRLLHLHAHMLHLISDFNVISLANGSPECRDVQSEAALHHVSEGPAADSTAHNAAVASQSVRHEQAAGTDTAASNMEQQQQARQDGRRRRRVLRVSETEAHLVRARINIEPVDAMAFRPATTTEGRPMPEGGVRGRPTLIPVFDRRRSQSASDTQRRTLDGAPVQITVTNSGSRASAVPAVSTSLHTAPFNPGAAAIIHRVDIPIISMNMLNLPIPAFFEHVNVTTSPPSTTPSRQSEPVISTATSDPTTTAATTTTTSSTTTTTTPVPRPSNSAGRDADHDPDSIPPPSAPAVAPHPPGLPPGPTDPFLLCHSRHFAHEPHYRRSTMGGSFGIPVPFPSAVQFVPTGAPSARAAGVPLSASRPTAQSSGVPPSEQSSTAPEVQTDTPTGTSNRTTTGPQVRSTSVPFPSDLSQQIAGFISAATNAATSAAAMGGGDVGIGPFNVFLTSSPMQFSVTANRSAPRTTTAASDAATSDSTPNFTTATTVGSVPPPVLTVPNWATSSDSSSDVTKLDGLNLLLNEIVQDFVDTVWHRLWLLAAEHQRVDFLDLTVEPPVSIPQQGDVRDQRIPVGLLTDVISAFRTELSSAGGESEQTRFCASSLDGLRAHLRHLLAHAESALAASPSGNNLVDMLVELVFDRCNSDAVGSRSRLEACGLLWVSQSGGESADQLIDIRASLVRLLRMNLAAQLELWRTSPTNFGFGSTLLLTLCDCFVDFLCLTDILVHQLACFTGIPCTLETTHERHLKVTNRVQDLLRARLISNGHFYLGSQDSRHLSRELQRGFDECFARYVAMDSAALQRKWDYLKSTCLVFRRVALPQVMDVDVSLDDGACLEDPPFVDACSELPAASDNGSDNSDNSLGVKARPNQLTFLTADPPSRLKSGARSPSCSPSGKNSPLPDWTPKPDEVPDPWTRGLDPHPDSARVLVGTANLLNPEGWHAVLPAEWVDVVAGDVDAMARNAQSANGDARAPQSFSDAYIAGMPAKRRKVMQEHARSVAKPPSAFFTDCLSDAIRVSGCEPNSTECVSDSATPMVQTGTSASYSPERELDLAASLKDLVSEEIAKRLSSDPDFDPVQFPLSNEVFVKNKSHLEK
ncbi:large proline-rich protein BAG6 [Clonorchis sinensis]|uniref:Large proline-rich protein BAG6 n=3 Tax=Clonorchis sinensis TaxID=79923 RepID=G7YCE0_CLOSI|nr:large proline-rich protein BAG6 [Clonorchis sinensis]